MKILIVIFVFFLSSIDAKSKLSCKCRINVLPKIDNGHVTSSNVQWIIAIRDKLNNETLCNGILINESISLVPASCLVDRNLQDLKLIAGVHNLTNCSPNDEYEIDNFTAHSKFNQYQPQNGFNIGYIKHKSIKLQKRKTELACLDLDFNRAGKNENLLVTSFGHTNEKKNKFSNLTRYAYVKQRTDLEFKNMIITRSVNKNQKLCDSDIGAALHKTSRGITKVIALMSFSEGGFDENGNIRYCTEDSFFTSLPKIKQWIKSIVPEHC